jgi:aminoglycoside phosphotransferase (APT) family kinase protein
MSRILLPDDPVPIGPRDEDFVARLKVYLSQELGLSTGADVKRFPGGRANVTYLVVDGVREVVVRRPPFGPIPPRSHDMEREYRVMTALGKVLPFVPKTLALCSNAKVSDRPFFVMERASGFVLRDEWPAFLSPDRELRRRMAESFLRVMAELHAVEPFDVGLEHLGRPEGFMARQVDGWRARCRDSLLDGDERPEQVFTWLAAQTVPAQPAAIVHNDLKFDNVMLDWDDPSQVRAVFDWDMATLGDPLADLGLVLTYWGCPGDDAERHGGRLPVTALDGFPPRQWVIDEYARTTGRDVSAIRFYEVFGLAKLAVLCQQLLARYRQGESDDARLAVYETQVPAIWREAHRLASGSRNTTENRQERGSPSDRDKQF